MCHAPKYVVRWTKLPYSALCVKRSSNPCSAFISVIVGGVPWCSICSIAPSLSAAEDQDIAGMEYKRSQVIAGMEYTSQVTAGE